MCLRQKLRKGIRKERTPHNQLLFDDGLGLLYSSCRFDIAAAS